MTELFRKFLMTGSLFAMLAVILGAMAAHGLKSSLDAYSLAIFKTASTYQMYHSIALIIIALSSAFCTRHKLLQLSGWFFIAGIIIFSGSLYWLSLSGIKWLGMITPIGGLGFIIGWLLFALSFVRPKEV